MFPLHIGDTYLPPAVALDAFDWGALPHAELYAYGAPPGWSPLIDAIVGKLCAKNAIAATPSNVQTRPARPTRSRAPSGHSVIRATT